MSADPQDETRLLQQLQGLLSEGLPADEVRALLARLADDPRARELAHDVLVLERQGRAAYGYDLADARMRNSLAALLTSLRENGAPAGSRLPAAQVARAARRPALRFRRLLPFAAAAAVVVASLYIGASAYLENQNTLTRLSQLGEAAALPRLTEAERASYSRIWSEVGEAASGSKPWILLSDSGGEFGYLPAVSGDADQGLLLVRCIVLAPDGRQVETVNLLVPARRGVRLSLPAIGQLAGQPIGCDIATHGTWAAVGLTVGRDPAEAMGVRGRVGFEDRSAEIGQFRLNGKRMRVVVQAVPLGAVS